MEHNPRPNTTPIVRCSGCDHPIDWHTGQPGGCTSGPSACSCRMTPNLIANAAIYGALTAGLTRPQATPPQRISRQPDGSWS